MRPALRSLLVLLAVCFAPVAQAAEQVDLLLVLASDVSRSIDQPKFQVPFHGVIVQGQEIEQVRILQ